VYPSGPDIESQKFTSKERDAETGLDFFGARYMSGAMGRWTTPDITFADQNVFDPQSWNLYGYVRNNPLRFIDGNGTQTQLVNLTAWLAKNAPELSATVKAVMAAHDAYTFAQALKEVVWGPQSPPDKIQKAIESDDVGIAVEGIIGKLVYDRFPGDVVGVGVPVKDPANPGLLLTDLDIQLKFAIVEIKSGKNPVNMRQLAKQQQLGLPVLIFAPEATPNQKGVLQGAGARVFSDLNLLYDELQRLKTEFDPGKRPTILRPK